MGPEKLWQVSRQLEARGRRRSARLVKALNKYAFSAILPPEAVVGDSLSLGHLGQGVVVHPNVSIGRNVHLWHGVTLAVSAPPGHEARLVIEDGVTIGAGAVVITRQHESLTVGAGSVIGANSVVTRDVPPGVVVAGNPARVLHKVGEGTASVYR